MANTSIEWTDHVWNPTTGCDRVSAGCDHCYALTMAKRLKGMGSAKYQTDGDPTTSGPGFGIAVHPDSLSLPLSWRKPRRIFVNSMSDLFHDGVPDEFIARVFAIMSATPRHTYQVLTKRHARMRSLLKSAGWHHKLIVAATNLHTGAVAPHLSRGLPISFTWPLPNVWLGVSAEDQRWADIRIPALLDTPAAVRFISAEPLIGPVDLGIGDPHQGHESDDVNGYPHPRICLTCSTDDNEVECFHREPGGGGIDWVIAGGESGPGARPSHPDWFRSLRDQCSTGQVPFLLKQWGEWGPQWPLDKDGRAVCSGAHTLADDGTLYGPNDLSYPDGPRYGEAIRARHDKAHLTAMYRVGKKTAGRELDGRVHDEYPQATR